MSQVPQEKRPSRCNTTDPNGPPRKVKCKMNYGDVSMAAPLGPSPKINTKYVEQSFKDCIGKALRDGIEASHIGSQAEFINDPFTCCVLPNFIDDQRFLEDLKEELSGLDYRSKSNDLYKFKQSDALHNVSSPIISALKKVLYEDFLSWLREVLGIPFIDTFDLTSSKYNYTDVLLCHDDELEGRRVAFILYLVPPWEESDGGTLDLFDMDDHGQPRAIVKSLVPKWNNFVFFEVTPKSFHQVSEVLNRDKCRLSVSGWFHGPTVPRPQPYIQPRSVLAPHIDIEENLFADWIDESYLDFVNQSDIQETFSNESEIQLPTFFESEKYDAVQSALKDGDVRWTRRGPANKRHYEVADPETLPPVVRECLDVMKCEYFFLLLSNLTALRLHEQAPYSSDDEDDNDGDNGDENDAGHNGGEEEREKTVKNGEEEERLKEEDSALGDEDGDGDDDDGDDKEDDDEKEDDDDEEDGDDIKEEEEGKEASAGAETNIVKGEQEEGEAKQSKKGQSEEKEESRTENDISRTMETPLTLDGEGNKVVAKDNKGGGRKSEEVAVDIQEVAVDIKEVARDNKDVAKDNKGIARDSKKDAGASKRGARSASSTPRCRAEVRRWTHGCYTLLHDTDTEGCEYALDASIYLNTGDYNPDGGGYVSYIAKGEDEELLSILPRDNSLSLVYRDKETLRFVKHINDSFVKPRGGISSNGTSQPAFYELYLVYYE